MLFETLNFGVKGIFCKEMVTEILILNLENVILSNGDFENL